MESLSYAQGEAEQSDYRYVAKEIKDGLQHMVPAARTRANAVYYGFIVLALGLIVMVRSLIVVPKIGTGWSTPVNCLLRTPTSFQTCSSIGGCQREIGLMYHI